MAFFETLESRVLFTTSAAHIAGVVHAIKVGAVRVKADVNALTSKLAKDEKTINADLAHLGVTAAQATLTQNLVAAAGAFTSDQSSDIKFYIPELNTETATLVSQEKQLAKTPGNADLVQELKGDFAVLGTISIYGNVPFTYGSMAPPVYAAMDAIKSANPSSTKVSGDIKNLEAGLKASATKNTKDAGKLFDTDISNMESAYPYP